MSTQDKVIAIIAEQAVLEPSDVALDSTLEDLGIHPTSLDAVLPSYLWMFRPSGQYAALKESAKNLKG